MRRREPRDVAIDGCLLVLLFLACLGLIAGIGHWIWVDGLF